MLTPALLTFLLLLIKLPAQLNIVGYAHPTALNMDVKDGFGEACASPGTADEIAQEQVEMGDKPSDGKDCDEAFEVFGNSENGVNFRVLNWQWASIIFLKRESHK